MNCEKCRNSVGGIYYEITGHKVCYACYFNPDSTPHNAIVSETILDEAARITSTDRRRDYGTPADNFEQIAKTQTGYLSRKLKPGEVITPRDVVWLNILQKACRDTHTPKRDNLVDTAGYAHVCQLATDELERRASEPPKTPSDKCCAYCGTRRRGGWITDNSDPANPIDMCPECFQEKAH